MPSHILLTGASSGIGRATLDLLLERGHFVIGTARDVSKPVITHEHCIWLPLDLTSTDSRLALLTSIEDQ